MDTNWIGFSYIKLSIMSFERQALFLDNDTLFLISFELWEILTLKLNFLGPSISAGTLDFITFRVVHYIYASYN